MAWILAISWRRLGRRTLRRRELGKRILAHGARGFRKKQRCRLGLQRIPRRRLYWRALYWRALYWRDLCCGFCVAASAAISSLQTRQLCLQTSRRGNDGTWIRPMRILLLVRRLTAVRDWRALCWRALYWRGLRCGFCVAASAVISWLQTRQLCLQISRLVILFEVRRRQCSHSRQAHAR